MKLREILPVLLDTPSFLQEAITCTKKNTENWRNYTTYQVPSYILTIRDKYLLSINLIQFKREGMKNICVRHSKYSGKITLRL